MNLRFLLTPLFAVTAASFAADLPTVPAEPIATKKELLFSDDFERSELGKSWAQVVPTFTVENGALKGTQTRVNTPASEGKPAVVGTRLLPAQTFRQKTASSNCGSSSPARRRCRSSSTTASSPGRITGTSASPG